MRIGKAHFYWSRTMFSLTIYAFTTTSLIVLLLSCTLLVNSQTFANVFTIRIACVQFLHSSYFANDRSDSTLHFSLLFGFAQMIRVQKRRNIIINYTVFRKSYFESEDRFVKECKISQNIVASLAGSGIVNSSCSFHGE